MIELHGTLNAEGFMTNTQTTKEVLSRKEAAEYLGVCKTTLDRLGIPKTQIRRRVLYRREILDKWLSQNTKSAKGKGSPA
jgi:excisionase family DNA binding protein